MGNGERLRLRYDEIGGAPVPRAHRHSGYGAVASVDAITPDFW